MTRRKTPSRGPRGPQTEPTPVDEGSEPTQAPAPQVFARKRRQGAVPTISVTPKIGVGTTRKPATKVPPQAAYLLYFNPERWTIIAGRVVPQLGKAKLIAGANGCDYDYKRKVWVTAPMTSQLEENGYKIIPWEIDGDSYIRKDPATGGYYSRWERVYSGSSRIQDGAAEYATWLQGLIDTGFLPPPPTYILEALLGDEERRANATRDGNPRVHKLHIENINVITEELARAIAEEEQAIEAGEPIDVDEEPAELVNEPPVIDDGGAE